jgi:hypothetical protein
VASSSKAYQPGFRSYTLVQHPDRFTKKAFSFRIGGKWCYLHYK